MNMKQYFLCSLVSFLAAGPTQKAFIYRAIAKLPMGRTDLVRWKAKDGTEIEGLLTYPAG